MDYTQKKKRLLHHTVIVALEVFTGIVKSCKLNNNMLLVFFLLCDFKLNITQNKHPDDDIPL